MVWMLKRIEWCIESQGVIKSDNSLIKKPAVIVYNSRKEAIQITHENIVASASALILEYEIK